MAEDNLQINRLPRRLEQPLRRLNLKAMEDIGTMVVAELHFHLRTVRALNAIPILNIGVVQNMDFAEAPKSIVFAIRVLIFDPWASLEKCDQIEGKNPGIY